jgi:multidrug efflux pump
MSISLIAVFIPILLMGGIVGRLFREFAMTLSCAILISLIISLTTTPMMAARLIDEPAKPGEAEAQRRRGGWRGLLSHVSNALERGFNWMAETYEGSLIWALDHKRIVLLSLLATIAFNVYLYAIVPKGFFPQQDTGQLQGGIQVDQASSFESTKLKFIKLVDIVRKDPAIDTTTAFSYGAGGFMFVALKPRAERPGETADDVINRIRPKTLGVSGAQLFLQASQDFRFGGRASAAQYQYTLQSDDIDALHTWSDKLTTELKKRPELTDVNSDQQEHGLETFITIDRDKASRLGLTAAAVDNVLNDAFAQRQVATIYNALNQYRVVMTVAPQFAVNPSALDQVYVSPGQGTVWSSSAAATGSAADPERTSAAALSATTGLRQGATPAAGLIAVTGGVAQNQQTPVVATPAGPRQQSAPLATTNTAAAQQLNGAGTARSTTGNANQVQTGAAVSTSTSRMVPLSSFATYAPSSTAVSVQHQGQAVATTISFNLAPGQSLSQVQAVIHEAEEAISMPNTVHGSFAGTAQIFADTTNNQPLLILAALVAVYIVLGVLYESYIHPITVLSTLPSAGVGALLALMAFHVEFDIIALIGVILLIGIVKKNAILIIDFALHAEREQGLSAYDAIYQASVLRFRPILMTTMAAILGALPLAFGLGEGGELRRPLGIAIVGGLIASQVLTLLTTPVVYLYMDKLRRRGRRRGDKPLPDGGRGPVGAADPTRVPDGTGHPAPAGA